MLSLYVPTVVAVHWHTPTLSTPFIYSSLFCPASFPGLSVGSNYKIHFNQYDR